MEKRWVLRSADESLVSLHVERLKVPPLLARILLHRGLTEPAAAGRFLSSSLRSDLPSPFLMRDMDRAVGRLVRAIRDKEPICIWGDYDVDGTTGTAVLVSFLSEVGAQPLYHIPHRIDEGYGMNVEGLTRLRRDRIRLVVTVDCGISNHREIAQAQEMGVDVVVVDHHEPPESLPPAVAILNPHRADCAFPDKGLCAAGLAFYLTIGLRAKLRETGWFAQSGVPDLRRHLDIVTLGTIADMVPLTGTNRVLTRRGLVELGGSTRPGLLALKEVAGLSPGELGVGQVAFQLGPRINAAGRVDDAMKVVELLTTDSYEVASRIARELDDHNRERRAVESRVLEEALSQLNGGEVAADQYSVVLGGEGWHPGVLGIVASRIVERCYRPTVVVAFQGEDGKGSARSIRGFHMVEGLHRCSDLLEKFGGHEYAGGLSIRKEQFASFKNRFEETARKCLAPEDLLPVLEIDAELDFSHIGFELTRELEVLKPFGIKNPEPLFMTEAVEVSGRRLIKGGSRFRLRQGGRSVGAVAFGLGEEFAADPGARLDIVYRLAENEWNGTSAVELRIVDARLSG